MKAKLLPAGAHSAMIEKNGVVLDERISTWLEARASLLANPAKLPSVGGPWAKAFMALGVMLTSFGASVAGLPWWLSVGLGLWAAKPMSWGMKARAWRAWREGKNCSGKAEWRHWWRAVSLQSQADALRWIVIFAMLAAKASNRLGPKAHAWATGWAMGKWSELEIKMREAAICAWTIKCKASPEWGIGVCHAWALAIGLAWGGGESRALWKSRLAQARSGWSPGRACDDSEWVAACWALTGSDASWAPISDSPSAKRECAVEVWNPEGWSFARAYQWSMDRRTSAGNDPSVKAWDALAMYRAQDERSGLLAGIEACEVQDALPRAKPRRL